MFSASSISLKIFLKKYGEIQKKLTKEVDAFVREGYFGGRCEVFGNPKINEQILYYDYKGMYGKCMKENIPVGPYKYKKKPKNFKKRGFYRIRWVSNLDIPILPKKLDKLFFVNGKHIGVYWVEEIELFIEEGGIVLEIIECWYSVGYKKAIEPYINEMEAIRDKGGLYKEISKLLVNSLYGRLGMVREFEEIILEYSTPDIDEYVQLNDFFLYKQKKTIKGISNVFIAAAITAKARIKLYKTFKAIILSKGRILYCDTDSVVATYDKDNNIIGKNIGQIIFDPNNPKTIINNAVFTSPKSYAIKYNNFEIIKIKGFNTKYITFKQFSQSFWNETLLEINPNLYNKLQFNYSIGILKRYVNLNLYDKRT